MYLKIINEERERERVYLVLNEGGNIINQTLANSGLFPKPSPKEQYKYITFRKGLLDDYVKELNQLRANLSNAGAKGQSKDYWRDYKKAKDEFDSFVAKHPDVKLYDDTNKKISELYEKLRNEDDNILGTRTYHLRELRKAMEVKANLLKNEHTQSPNLSASQSSVQPQQHQQPQHPQQLQQPKTTSGDTPIVQPQSSSNTLDVCATRHLYI